MPGAFDAWCRLLRDWGTWELPASWHTRSVTRGTVSISCRASARRSKGVRPLFEEEWKTSAAVFLPGGEVPGARHVASPGPRWPRRWERLCREAVGAKPGGADRCGAAALSIRGFVAEAVDRFFRATDVLDVTRAPPSRFADRAEDFAALGGAAWKTPWLMITAATRVLKCGPWSQGPALLQQLALLRGFDVGAMDPLGAISSTRSSSAQSWRSPTARLTTAIRISPRCR